MKRIIITFFTLLLVTSLNPSFAADNSGPSTTNESTSTESFESKLEKARKLVDQKKWKSAISELKKLSKTNKSNADVWNLLGFAARNSGDLKNSATYYKKALSIDPKHLGALEYQGELFLKLKQVDKAKKNLELLKNYCGTSCAEYKDLDKAIKSYKK
ncbi:MAG: tetratricopeptide repeat protein [Actinomycetes bacterium]